MDRRKFIKYSAFGIASVAPAMGVVTRLPGAVQNAAAQSVTHRAKLSITEADVEMIDGTFVYMWAFEDLNQRDSVPEIPGPLNIGIRDDLVEGDTVEVEISNHLDEDHAFAILTAPPDGVSSGSEGVNFVALTHRGQTTGIVVVPGRFNTEPSRLTFAFVAPKAGTYLYFDPLNSSGTPAGACVANPGLHMNGPINRVLGLHGVLTVLPRTEVIDSGNIDGATSTGFSIPSTRRWIPSEHNGRVVEIVNGTGVGQLRRIRSNTGTTLTVTHRWDVVPDRSSQFRIVTTITPYSLTDVPRFTAVTGAAVQGQIVVNIADATHLHGRSVSTDDRGSIIGIGWRPDPARLELLEIDRISGNAITLTEPLRWDHSSGEVVGTPYRALFEELGTVPHFPGEPWNPSRTRVWAFNQIHDPKRGRNFNEVARAGGIINAAEFADAFVPCYFTINGLSGAFASHNHAIAPTGRIGQPLLIRMVNVGVVSHSPHIHGNHVYLVGTNNGVLLGSAPAMDTFTVPPLRRADWLVPFHRPPDIPGGHLRSLRTLLATELSIELGGVPQSPLAYPMHCHTEMSQTAAGGNYAQGLVTHGLEITGDLDGDFPRVHH